MLSLKNIKGDRLSLAIIVIIIAGAAVYANSINGKFIWDDNMLIRDNTHIKHLSNIPRFFTEDMGEGAGERTGFYRPTQVLSYALGHSLWGLDERGYHITNVLLHISVALCVFWLVNILFADKLIAFVAGLLFVVHPVNVEAVSYISGRADLFAGIFVLLSLIYYIKNVKNDTRNSYSLTVFLYMLALLSKEISLVVPVLMIGYNLIFGRKPRARTFISLLAVSAFYIVFRFMVLNFSVVSDMQAISLSERMPGVFAALASYVRLLILPFDLHMDYGLKIFNLPNPIVLLGILLFASAITLMVKYRKRDKLLVFSVFWFILTLSPQSNIYPLTAYMAEHWLYLPSIGFSLILARWFSLLCRNNRFQYLGIFLVSGIVIFYSVLTVNQNKYWNEPISFYERTLRFAPYSSGVLNNLGVSYTNRGEYERAVEMLKKAIAVAPKQESAYFNLGNVYREISENQKSIDAYRKAIEIRPDYAKAYNNMGFVYGIMNKDEEAIANFRKAIDISPDEVNAYNNLADTLKEIDNINEAVKLYRLIMEMDPNRVRAYYELIEIYQERKEYNEAIRIYEKLIRIDRPGPRLYNNLGLLYAAVGRYRDAVVVYEKAIVLDPIYVKAYNNLGAMYGRIGSHKEAFDILDKALKLDPEHAETHNNIAVAYHEIGSHELAIKHCDRAIELGFSPDPEFINALKEFRQ